MKNLALSLAVILLLSKVAFAQDPGAQDSIIVDSVHVSQGATYAVVPIYAVCDDAVAAYCMPLGWFPRDNGVNPINNLIYFYPLTTWPFKFDTLILNEGFVRIIGISEIDPQDGDPIYSPGARTHIMTMIFHISPDIGPQVIRIDTVYDRYNGSLFLGLEDGLTAFVPAFQYGQLVIGNPAGVGFDALPNSYSLNQNYPNPFNPSTTIEFTLPEAGHVSLEIYDILGQRVKSLLESDISSGQYSVSWNGTDNAGNEVRSGTYFYKLTANDFVQTKKMLLIR
jgi:hypothetical protein